MPFCDIVEIFLPFQVNHPLQLFQKPCRVAAVHLHVVELEGDRQQRLDPAFAVLAPHHHGIQELVGVLVHHAVELGLDHGRGADNHVAVEKAALARFRHLGGQRQIVAVELLQVGGEGDVARVDAALAITHHHVDGHPVVAEQLAALRQQVELLGFGGRLADAPAHQRVEPHAALPAEPRQTAHIHRFHQGHHRHRRVQPHLEGECPLGLFGVDFGFHFLI